MFRHRVKHLIRDWVEVELVFADDTKVFREIQSDEDRQKLQQDIDELLIWSQKWQLPFNESKCRLCTMGRQPERQITTSVVSKSWK